MSKTVQFVDILKATTGTDTIDVQTKQSYHESFIDTDFEDDNIPNWRAVKSYADAHGGGGGSGLYLQLKINAGTTIPYNIDLTSAAFIDQDSVSHDLTGYNIQVQVTAEIEFNGDDTTLVEFSDILKVKNYVDNTKAAIESIDVYGHDNGDGTFTEDTYITLRQ